MGMACSPRLVARLDEDEPHFPAPVGIEEPVLAWLPEETVARYAEALVRRDHEAVRVAPFLCP